MIPQAPKPNEKAHWESVHLCPKCARAINLAEIDLMAATTGIVNCPNCDWSGRIEIRVVDGATPE